MKNAITKDVGPLPRGSTPLCVDLDGTLVRTDLLHESIAILLKRNPLSILALVLWLFKGKAGFKDEVSKRVTIDPSILPYNQRVLNWVRGERNGGRYIVLATASNHRLAEIVASYLDCFDEIVASDADGNISDREKCAALVSKFGKRRFDYVGNSSKDVVVWEQCDQAIVVEATKRTLNAARRRSTVAEIIPKPRVGLRVWLRAIRVQQWIKNVLIFVPLFTSHRFTDVAAIRSAVILFFAFSSTASATYICNDLLDLTDDRKHVAKSSRPFANGSISITQGLALAAGFLLAAAVLLWYVSVSGRIVVGAYLLLTLAYSFWLKRKLILGVLVLTSLYITRIIAGGVSTHVRLSDWLLSFSLFLFISLAACKRSSEAMNLLKSNKNRADARFYEMGDLEPLNICGISSGIVASLLLLLYGASQHAQSLYRSPRFLYLLCPILFYWISRLWLLTFRGDLKEDPMLFALHDPVSYLVVVAMIATAALATFARASLAIFPQ